MNIVILIVLIGALAGMLGEFLHPDAFPPQPMDAEKNRQSRITARETKRRIS